MKGLTLIVFLALVVLIIYLLTKGVKVEHTIGASGVGGFGQSIRENTRIQQGINEILSGFFGGEWRVNW